MLPECYGVLCSDCSTKFGCNLRSPIKTNGNQLFVRFDDRADITQNRFVVYSSQSRDLTELTMRYRDQFVSDMTEMILHWTKNDDQMILVHFPAENYTNNSVNPRLDPVEFSAMEQGRATRLLYLRSQLLICFNFFCTNFQELFTTTVLLYTDHLSPCYYRLVNSDLQLPDAMESIMQD